MSKIKKVATKKNTVAKADEPPAGLGRKRDHTRDAHIIEAALNILAEVGFDTMTMDMVAAHAKAGKATVYRRWKSKAELVRDALIWMSKSSVDLARVPDTGSLREDLLALQKPYTADHSEKKLRVLAGLGSFYSEHQKMAEEAMTGIFEPWTKVNLFLMQRAVERGEISAQADIEMACQVIIAMTAYRTRIENKPFEKSHYASLLDNIVLPALRDT